MLGELKEKGRRVKKEKAKVVEDQKKGQMLKTKKKVKVQQHNLKRSKTEKI